MEKNLIVIQKKKVANYGLWRIFFWKICNGAIVEDEISDTGYVIKTDIIGRTDYEWIMSQRDRYRLYFKKDGTWKKI